MQQSFNRKKVVRSLRWGLVIAGLFLLSGCNICSSEDVETWRVMGSSLQQKQTHLRAMIADYEGEQQVLGGDPARAAEAFRAYGCSSCHMIPGVRGAASMVGPPLTSWSQRGFIAGALPNTPYNLVQWLKDPQAIEPGTAMPDLDVTEQDARDMAAYLFILGRE